MCGATVYHGRYECGYRLNRKHLHSARGLIAHTELSVVPSPSFSTSAERLGSSFGFRIGENATEKCCSSGNALDLEREPLVIRLLFSLLVVAGITEPIPPRVRRTVLLAMFSLLRG